MPILLENKIESTIVLNYATTTLPKSIHTGFHPLDKTETKWSSWKQILDYNEAFREEVWLKSREKSPIPSSNIILRLAQPGTKGRAIYAVWSRTCLGGLTKKESSPPDSRSNTKGTHNFCGATHIFKMCCDQDKNLVWNDTVCYTLRGNPINIRQSFQRCGNLSVAQNNEMQRENYFIIWCV